MIFFFKQKTAYEMRISDWSSDVCSSDLFLLLRFGGKNLCLPFAFGLEDRRLAETFGFEDVGALFALGFHLPFHGRDQRRRRTDVLDLDASDLDAPGRGRLIDDRSEEHTSELQSLMRISYAVFFLQKKKNK